MGVSVKPSTPATLRKRRHGEDGAGPGRGRRNTGYRLDNIEVRLVREPAATPERHTGIPGGKGLEAKVARAACSIAEPPALACGVEGALVPGVDKRAEPASAAWRALAVDWGDGFAHEEDK